jgi:hypothetical protein
MTADEVKQGRLERRIRVAWNQSMQEAVNLKSLTVAIDTETMAVRGLMKPLMADK